MRQYKAFEVKVGGEEIEVVALVTGEYADSVYFVDFNWTYLNESNDIQFLNKTFEFDREEEAFAFMKNIGLDFVCEVVKGFML